MTKTKYIQAYDIGETLATSDRDVYLNQILGKGVSFKTDPIRYSAAQVEGIKKGRINVWPLEGIVEQLEVQINKGSEIIAITQGTREMAEAFLEGSDLRKYISRLYATDRKTAELFVSIFEELYSKNRIIQNYHDDNMENIIEARKAAEMIMKKYSLTFKTHLVGDRNV